MRRGLLKDGGPSGVVFCSDMNSDAVVQLLTCGAMDALHILHIVCDLNVIPLALQITNICGNVMVSPFDFQLFLLLTLICKFVIIV